LLARFKVILSRVFDIFSSDTHPLSHPLCLIVSKYLEAGFHFADLRAQQNGAGDRWQDAEASKRLTTRTMRVPPPMNGMFYPVLQRKANFMF